MKQQLENELELLVGKYPSPPENFNYEDYSSQRYIADLEDWYRDVAVVVSDLIQHDRKEWEEKVNWTLDIFFSPKPCTEQKVIRTLENKIRKTLRDGYQGFLKYALNCRVIKDANLLTKIGMIAEYLKQPIITPEEWLLHNHRQMDFLLDIFPKTVHEPPVDISPYAPGYIPFVNKIASDVSRRLHALAWQFSKLCSSMGQDETIIEIRKEIDSLNFIQQLQKLHDDLFLSATARQVRPYNAITTLYFVYKSNADLSLLRMGDNELYRYEINRLSLDLQERRFRFCLPDNAKVLLESLRSFLVYQEKTVDPKPKTGLSQKEINSQIWLVMKELQKKKGKFNIRDIASEIGCSISSIHKTPSWKQYMVVQKPRKTLNAKSLPSNDVLADTRTIPDIDEVEPRNHNPELVHPSELEKLIREQEDDANADRFGRKRRRQA